MDELSDGHKGIVRPRVNGELMAQFVGKPVCIIGSAHDVEPGGMGFKLKAADNEIISVRLTEPHDGYLSGIVEVYGTVTSKNTILCDSIIDIPPEYVEKMDLSQYNLAVQFLHATNHYEAALATDMNGM